jgi:hypothetical protein
MGISYAKKMGISSKDHGSLKQWIGVRDKSTANHGFLFQSHQRCRRRREINTPKKKAGESFNMESSLFSWYNPICLSIFTMKKDWFFSIGVMVASTVAAQEQ